MSPVGHFLYMDDIASIPRRIARLKSLAKVYYPLAEGALIERHGELLRVFDIRGSRHEKHPHKMMRVYITRKAVKHFVESRKKELIKKHTDEEVMEHLYFALDAVQECITQFDKYEWEPDDRCAMYTKDYSSVGRPSIRIVVEQKTERLEIRSMHFCTFIKRNRSN